ncbi:hypothetical protein SAMN04488556_0022 [Halostagnicola kamekurae]|uniref:Uncharacterized protein n=1 Tax=Halostagnicola kamekurae TaxID=619731 RepID=A0A1I6V3L7_9EURY|nr:hypothetical protein SAMN04488556_0022 [Halostagnicola kamekurae]
MSSVVRTVTLSSELWTTVVREQFGFGNGNWKTNVRPSGFRPQWNSFPVHEPVSSSIGYTDFCCRRNIDENREYASSGS